MQKKSTCGTVTPEPFTTVSEIKSNWTKWITIQGEIRQVISKLDECAAQGRLELTSMIIL